MPRHPKATVTPEEVVQVLNEAVKLDPKAMYALVEARVPCNEALADHPTIQVSAYDEQTGEPTPGQFKVGILGLLNGLFGTDSKGWGYIMANFDVWCNGCQAVKPCTPKGEVKVGKPCPDCGMKLLLGDLISFEVKQWHEED